jgi:hypothetical protein
MMSAAAMIPPVGKIKNSSHRIRNGDLCDMVGCRVQPFRRLPGAANGAPAQQFVRDSDR